MRRGSGPLWKPAESAPNSRARPTSFISLAERTRIANSAGADLFVSIHLNSSPNPDTTGIEVYYLNNTTDRATIRLARMENGGANGYGASNDSNLNYILTDMRQNYKAIEAASLARMIDAQTVADLDAGLGLNVNALGAKMGPFYVLVGAHMPAVLVECGFMSNRRRSRAACVAAIPGRARPRDRRRQSRTTSTPISRREICEPR